MAKAFGQVLVELAREDPRICGVSCDCWGFLAPLAQEFPDRAVEVGIAEQNLIGVAAGLALRGKIPFAIGMNPFVTMRCFEQIRTDLGYGARNVNVIGGYGGGIMFAGWGPTHHAVEEMALMRLVPMMTVIMPADAFETEQAVRAAAAMEGPFYISLAGGRLPVDQEEEARSFEVGKAVGLRDGDRATIIAVGPTVPEALCAADILTERGVGVRVLNMHTIKPIDRGAILCAARETQRILTIEEHTVIGGLGGAVAEVLAEAGAETPLKRLGLQDTFAVMSGSRQDLRDHLGITAEGLVREILAR